MPLELITAGESHGPGLTCIVEGLPAGLQLDREALDRDLARRQLGHGRGGRMKIERDRVTVTSGVRHGHTLGGPIALEVANRDYANWEERMNPWPVEAELAEVHLPRPGHADLVGTQKYGLTDVRDILERASARETAARVAGGALAKAFLSALGVHVFSHVIQITSVQAPRRDDLVPADFDGVDDSPVRCLDAEAGRAMVAEINALRKANESLGGVFEVRVFGLVPGLGSHVSWRERLDGVLGQAMQISTFNTACLGASATTAGCDALIAADGDCADCLFGGNPDGGVGTAPALLPVGGEEQINFNGCLAAISTAADDCKLEYQEITFCAATTCATCTTDTSNSSCLDFSETDPSAACATDFPLTSDCETAVEGSVSTFDANNKCAEDATDFTTAYTEIATTLCGAP